MGCLTGIDAKMSESSARSLFSLSWQSLAYGVGILGRQVAVYLALPLFTYYMDQEEFGVVAVTTALLAFLSVVLNAGLTPALFRLYNDSTDHEIRSQTIGSSQVVTLGYAFLIGLVLLIAAAPLSQRLLGDASYAYVMRVVAVIAVVQTAITFGNNLLRIQVRPLSSSLFNIFQIGIQLGAALVLVRVYNLGVAGYWLGYLAGALVGLVLMLWLVRHSLSGRVSRQRMQELLVYAFPLFPSLLALWALRLVDRFLIVSFAGLDSAAVYEIGYKIGMLVVLVVAPFSAAWPQFAFSYMHRDNARQIYRDVMVLVATGCTFVALIVTAFAGELVGLMAPPSYSLAVFVVPWVAFSQVFWGIYQISIIGLHLTKRTLYISLVTMFAAIINIGINLLLIPLLGILGAAIATFFAFLVLAVAGYVVAQRFYSYPVDWMRMGKLLLASIVVVALIVALGSLDIAIGLERVLRGVVLLAFPILLILFRFLSPSQGRSLLQIGTGMMRGKLTR